MRLSTFLINSLGIVIFISCLFVADMQAQMAIEWQNRIGTTTETQSANGIVETSDGGFLMVGGSGNNQVSTDFYIVKTDGQGIMQWQKTYGGSLWDLAYKAIECSTGGYLVVGTVHSNDGDVDSTHHGGSQWDGWVLRLDAIGNIIWHRTMGGTDSEQIFTVLENHEGNYVVAGYTSSNDGDLTGFNSGGGVEMWIVELDTTGNIVNQKVLGGTSNDNIWRILQLPDSSYIIAGASLAGGKDLPTGHGNWDFTALKVDTGFNIIWANVYGGSNQEQAYDIIAASDGGYVLCGETGSGNGQTSGCHAGHDFWIVKIDSIGNFEWQRCLGGSDFEEAETIVETFGQKYLISGKSWGSTNGDITNPISSGNDVWIICLDSLGNTLWDKSIGGGRYDEAGQIIRTSDGFFALAGLTNSYDHDVTGPLNSSTDMWIVKFTDQPNAIVGSTYLDANSNAVFDSTEQSLTMHKVSETASSRRAFSNSNGIFRMDLSDPGTFNVKADSISYHSRIPAIRTVSFVGVDNIDSLNDFAFQPAGNFDDLKIELTELSNIRPGFTTTYDLSLQNIGTNTLSGTVVLGHSNAITYNSSTDPPVSTLGDSVLWSFTSLAPYETRNISVTFTASTSLILGAINQVVATIRPLTSDQTPLNNVDTLDQIVVGSFDPNDIMVDITDIPFTQLSNLPYLEYRIRFQNTGTFPATFVRVTNPITHLLDMNTFEMISTSHNVEVNYLPHSRNMDFFFDNINLADSTSNEPESHGYIKYRVKPVSTLSINDVINNVAYIYFDYNAAVITNTAVTIVSITTGNASSKKEVSIRAYPNPNSGTFKIELNQVATVDAVISVYDMMGRLISSEAVNGRQTMDVDLQDQRSGIYFVNYSSSALQQSSKIIIRR